MAVWCMAHPWMTFFLGVLAIAAAMTTAVCVAAVVAYGKKKKCDEGGSDDA